MKVAKPGTIYEPGVQVGVDATVQAVKEQKVETALAATSMMTCSTGLRSTSSIKLRDRRTSDKSPNALNSDLPQ